MYIYIYIGLYEEYIGVVKRDISTTRSINYLLCQADFGAFLRGHFLWFRIWGLGFRISGSTLGGQGLGL